MRGLAIAAAKDPRTHFPARISNVYTDTLPEFSHSIRPDGLTTPCSKTAAALKMAPKIEMVGRVDIPRTEEEAKRLPRFISRINPQSHFLNDLLQ